MASGLPGRFLKADSSRSSLRLAFRISGSGPWQLKQLLARIGCSYWLKSRCCCAETEPEGLPLQPAVVASKAVPITSETAQRKTVGFNETMFRAKRRKLPTKGRTFNASLRH